MPAPFIPLPAGRTVTAGDRDYHVVEMGDRGRPVLFLHGGGPGCSAATDFGPVSERFARDHRCFFIDLLQYGGSSMETISGPMWSFHARSITLLMDALGIDRADLICNSWGGTIALCLAAEHPERARSLTVTGSMPVFHGPLAPLPEGGRRGRNARDAYYGGEGPTWEKMRDLMARLEWYDPDQIPDETVELRYQQSIRPEEMALAARSDDPRGEWQDLTGHLGRIRCKTLLCWGMQDAFLTPDYPLMLARMIPHGQLAVMDRASHHLQEERPHDYHAIVDGFLAQEEVA